MDHHPGPAIAALMKLSFDEEHRHAICALGEKTINRSFKTLCIIVVNCPEIL